MGRGSYITLFSPSDVTAFHRIYHTTLTDRLVNNWYGVFGAALDCFSSYLRDGYQKESNTLKILFDENYNFCGHISQVSSNRSYTVRDFRRTRKSLPLALAKQIAVALQCIY